MGRLDNHLDQSPYAGIQEVFRFHTAHEADYRHIHSRAEVLLLRGHQWSDAAEERGWIRALTENHILFDEALEHDLLAGSLDRYKAIILPDSDQLSSTLCAKLDAYVNQGGIVVSSGRSGRMDESFTPRENAALACLGITQIRAVRDDMVSAMFMIHADEKSTFPSFAQCRRGCLWGYADRSGVCSGRRKPIFIYYLRSPSDRLSAVTVAKKPRLLGSLFIPMAKARGSAFRF